MKHFRYLTQFISSQKNIVAIFVAVMIVPSIFLAITEPYSFTTIMASLLLASGFYLLWSLVCTRVGVMILLSLPFMVLGAFQLVLIYLFGNSIIAVDMFTNLLTTTVSEASELLGNLTPAIVGVCVLYIPLLLLGVHSLRIEDRLKRFVRRKYALVGLFFLLLGASMAGISKLRNSEFSIKYHIFPINVIYNITLSVERWHTSLNYPESSAGFSFEAHKDADTTRREIYVLVVGEASRAASWSLLGYERETNPLLKDQSNMVVFSDIITQSNTTHKSVPIILSPASAENFDSIHVQTSVVSLFKESGFRTAFFSNQTPNRSLVEFFADQADTTVYLNPVANNMSQELHYDVELLLLLQNLIARNEDNLFVVLHTYGSHFDFSKRYLPEDAHFKPDHIESVSKKNRANIINSYDNSIRETDRFLSRLISILDSANHCSALLYCADHGEEILDDDRNIFLHASPRTTYFQLHVASLGWFSDRYIDHYLPKYSAAQSNQSSPGSTANVFHTIADIADIRSPYVDTDRSLVSPHFVIQPRRYLNDYNQAVDFLNTGLGHQDFEMLDRHKVSYDKGVFVDKKY